MQYNFRPYHRGPFLTPFFSLSLCNPSLVSVPRLHGRKYLVVNETDKFQQRPAIPPTSRPCDAFSRTGNANSSVESGAKSLFVADKSDVELCSVQRSQGAIPFLAKLALPAIPFPHSFHPSIPLASSFTASDLPLTSSNVVHLLLVRSISPPRFVSIPSRRHSIAISPLTFARSPR